MGMVSKIILERINSEIKKRFNFNQWKSSDECLQWFRKISENANAGHKFIQCDISNFYPSISEELLQQALQWASEYSYISDLAIKVIIHSRRTILYDGCNIWCKKNNASFDISQGAWDGAEASDLVGLFMCFQVIHVHRILPNENFGLYRDDILGLACGGGPKIEREKKRIVRIFKI